LGYDILSNTTQKSWSCNQHSWGSILGLAQHFGWVPEHNAGTYYMGNDFQKVSDKDACGIARALDRAIVYIEAVAGINLKAGEETLRTFDVADVEHLSELVQLADAGGFIIA
jgi:hypothetical protein